MGLAVAGSPLRGAGLPVRGRVLDEAGQPLAGVRLALSRLPSYRERGELLLSGRAYADPAAEARTGSDGSFRIEAPESGFWSLVARGPGRVTMEYPLWPLVEPADLEPVRLLPAKPLTVRVVGGRGDPVAGAVVSALGSGPSEPPQGEGMWRPIRRRVAVTDDGGKALLPRFAAEALRLDAVAPALGAAVWKRGSAPGDSEVTLSLAPVPTRRLRAVTAAGAPVAGVIVWSAGPLPVARTDDQGGATVPLVGDEAAGVQLDGPGGLQAEAEVPLPAEPRGEAKGGAEGPPVVVTLEPTPERSGAVIEEGTPRGVAGAWVWSPYSPAEAVRTDRTGSYRLPLLPGRRVPRLEVAATGYVPTWVELHDPPSQEALPTVALTPAFAVDGTVADEAGGPLSGVAIRVKADRRRRARDPRALRSEGFARSDARGGFEVRGLLPGASYRLEAELDGFPPLRVDVPGPPEEVGASGRRVVMDLVLERGRRAAGRVAGAAGEPVAGARVHLLPEADRRSSPFPPTFEPLELAATTDEAGTFEIADVPGGKVEAIVVASGWASGEFRGLEVPHGSGRADLGVLTLDPEVPVEGRVVDSDGQPLAGALVSAREASGQAAFPFSESGRSRGEPATTGADGGFRLGGFAAGAVLSVQVSAEGYLPVSRRGVRLPTEAPLLVRLEPAATLTGRVVDTRGRPVAQALVGPSSRVWSQGVHSFVRTDDDGEFSLSPVAAGVQVLEARKEGYVTSAPRSVEVTAGREPPKVEIVLEAAAVLEGRVLTPDGIAVSGARVTATRRREVQVPGQEALTDGDGRFVLDQLAPGPVTVRAEKEGFTSAEVEAEAGGAASGVELVLGRGVEVSGFLADAAGEPLPAREVALSLSAIRFAMAGEARATSRTDGSFTISGVADGSYRITVMDRGRPWYVRPEPVVVAGSPVRGVEVRLPPEAAIRGRLIGLEPEDLPGLRIFASAAELGWPRPGRVLADGGYEISDLAPGEWRVRGAVPDGGPVATAEVSIEPGQAEAQADLRFERGLTLTGTVLRAGEPVAGLTVSVSSLTRPAGNSAQTDGAGRFRVRSLGRGTNVVQIQSPDLSLQSVRKVEMDGDRDVVFEVGGHRVAGTVVSADGAEAIGAAEVRAGRASADGFGGWSGSSALTNADGRFLLTDLEEGEWRLRVRKEGYGDRTVPVAVGTGDVELPPIRLERTPGLVLIVHLADGGVPQGVGAVAFGDGPQPVWSGGGQVGPDGRIVLAGVPRGTWSLTVSAADGIAAGVRVTVPGEPAPVRLSPACTVRLTVPGLEAAEAGVPSAQVRLTDAAGRPPWFLRGRNADFPMTGAALEIPNLSPGTWTVSVTAVDGRTWSGTVDARPGVTAALVLQ